MGELSCAASVPVCLMRPFSSTMKRHKRLKLIEIFLTKFFIHHTMVEKQTKLECTGNSALEINLLMIARYIFYKCTINNNYLMQALRRAVAAGWTHRHTETPTITIPSPLANRRGEGNKSAKKFKKWEKEKKTKTVNE